MKIIYQTVYCGKAVGVRFGKNGRLEVIYLDPKEEHSFSYCNGSNGEMDVVTEFVTHLMKNPQNVIDKT